MLRYRCADVTPVEQENIRRAFAGDSKLRLRLVSEVHGITIQSVLRMVLNGTLHIN
jgi:hypothetical protein